MWGFLQIPCGTVVYMHEQLEFFALMSDFEFCPVCELYHLQTKTDGVLGRKWITLVASIFILQSAVCDKLYKYKTYKHINLSTYWGRHSPTLVNDQEVTAWPSEKNINYQLSNAILRPLPTSTLGTFEVLLKMHHISSLLLYAGMCLFLQCFDVVGRAAGRASGL